ncbi:hypothetical protein KAFR_0G03780 [Kazachstania africana CBS 2517]|uniref:GH16 domain-containing protein n=1 Tax=Kazachstania africana (strain ATCC 22294 / BCRC 22015 / CBS 2517 / CECT 1963 / NBRC 1671 / NRRL Y-8276) TaxID=1071382 RepID=H2AYG1_KAZAF|nr:hypothetical protein KAFR_0G03780 [Kazachstania africana CBS 2517]CCF59411.1 hypothetical protein KAFR_0G03780 [Kazachstania africana CBS 2517]
MVSRNLSNFEEYGREIDDSNENSPSYSQSSSSNIPGADDVETQLLSNPFMNSEEDYSRSASSSIHYTRGEELNVVGYSNNQDTSDYSGYYSRNNDYDTIDHEINTNKNGLNANLLPPKIPTQSSTSLNTELSNNDILAPPAFDRYPLVGSRVTSMANIASPYTDNMNGNSLGTHSESSYVSSPNVFAAEQDFSPFGGYPTTSFPLLMEEKEEDDYLHNPDPEEESRLDKKRFVEDFRHMDRRSFTGLIGILFLFLLAIFIFIVLPALTYSGAIYGDTYSDVVEILSEYSYPTLQAIRTDLVDPDTPTSAHSRQAKSGEYWKLTFSDEFNAEGRTFYSGDDQFWQGPDFNYAATKDLEWYTPDAATTEDGTLKLRMDAFKNHNLYYRSGMLQSWNKLCFTQGILEVSAQLPNYGRVSGLWPGLWTMGNLGRPGYMATTDGVWPYSYDSCDAGITPNQSSPDGISYLPGQRLSVCTCDDEDHPNQGTGRGAPEIDIIEAETDTTLGDGLASQSMQIAPFDIWYIPDYDFIEIYNFSTTVMNTYAGGSYQQAVSAVSTLNTTWYEFGADAGYFQKYSMEYLNDDDDGYVRWFVGDVPTFTVYATALHPNGNIGWRRISKEPMSIILNLGISNNWAYIDWQMIYFPVTMSVDYVRIYQPNDSISITCDPDDYPTYEYISDHATAYEDYNLTSWSDTNYTVPKNILTGNCESSKYSLST